MYFVRKNLWIRMLAGMLGAVLLLLTGCRGGTPDAADEKPAETLDAKAERIVASMSTAEKVGQMVMIGIQGTDVDEDSLYMLHQYHIGGVLLFDRNIESEEQTTALTSHLQEQAGQKVPLFIGIDEEGGSVARGRGVIEPPPSQQEIGRSGETAKAEAWAEKTARRLKELGIQVNFAPVADVSADKDRSYSGDPVQVEKFVRAAVQGYEMNRVMYGLKHFPGIGRGTVDSHEDISSVTASREVLEKEDLVPFRAIINEHPELDYFILVSHLKYPAIDAEHPASQSRAVITGLLRGDMGYDGLIITDDLEMGAVAKHGSYREAGVLAVKAGADMFMMCHEYAHQTEAYLGLLAAVENGGIPMEQIDASVKRIVKAKLLH